MQERALKVLLDLAAEERPGPDSPSRTQPNSHLAGRHRRDSAGDGVAEAARAGTLDAPPAGAEDGAASGAAAAVRSSGDAWPALVAGLATDADSLPQARPAASADSSVRPDEGDGRPHRAWRHSYRLGLLAVLLVQSALALRLVWSNTAFQDEAEYLWYGHMEWRHWLHGTPLPLNYLSGSPLIYPPIGALADSVGGLVGARLLSLGFMLCATGLLYATASRLFSQRAGLIGAAMFVAVGPTTDMSAWATYDPMAICVMALASWLAVRAARSRASEVWIVLAAVAMVLADGTKWVTVLWSPIIVALVVLTAPTGWALAVARGARLLSYAVAVAAPALFLLGGRVSLSDVTTTTTQRGSGGDDRLSVLWNATPLIAVVVAVALLGFVLAWREREGRRPLLCAVLVVAGLLAPAFQAYDQTTVSQYKHVVFGLWFASMGAGYALSKAVVVNPAKGWRVGIAAAVFTGLLGYGQATGLYGWWPNSGRLIAALERQLPVNGPILMQQGDQMVANYYLLHASVQPVILTSYAYSPAAISAKIKYHQVGMIETDTGTNTTANTLQQSLAGKPRALQQAGYRRVARIPWRDPNGDRGWFTIWVLAGAS